MAQNLVCQPVFELWMEDVIDVGDGQTLNIAPLVLSCTYTDHEHGESDELSVEIDDFDARYFKGPWMPRKGQGISLTIGYADEPLAPRGRFVVDEVDFAGPPDIVTIRALIADINKPLRTDDHRAYEGVTLLDIAQRVADRHGYTLRGGDTGPMKDIRLGRITQNGEPDLSFLKRLARPYGYAFKIDAPELAFLAIADLESATPVVTIDRAELSSFQLSDTTRETYKACEVRYHDPRTGRLIQGHATGSGKATKNDTLKITMRCESDEQARILAEESLKNANRGGHEGTLTLPGRPALTAGRVLQLTGMLNLSGRYLIKTSTHRFSRYTGYVMDLEVRRV